jgi:hypothetical protein
MKTNKKFKANLTELLDSLDKEILDSSDKDILENVNKEELLDIPKLDNIINNKIVCFRKDQRIKSRQEYLLNIQNIAVKAFDLPNGINRKLEILSAFFQSNKNIPNEFTMAFRDGKDLSETDIDSLIQDLAELGLLNKNDLENEK